jgi:polyisoprenoid-binding protein YceI
MAGMTHVTVSSGRLDVPPPGRYRIDPEQSTVTIRTRHLFGLGPVRATLALRDGLIQVTAPPGASTVQASFAASTFQSRNPARDAAVLSPRLLDAEAYSSLSFTSTELVQVRGQVKGRAEDREEGQWWLRGELEVRGVTRLVEVRVIAVEGGSTTLRASAQVSIDRYDFGITAYRGLAARGLTVDLGIIAHRAAAGPQKEGSAAS